MLYEKFGKWYSRNYKKLTIIPLIVFLSAAAIFVFNHYERGEFFPKDIDLSGGTVVTVYANASDPVAKANLENEGFAVREIKSYETGRLIAVIVEAGPEFNQTYVINAVNQTFQGAKFDVRHVGPAMGASFLKTAQKSVIIGFVLMGLILASIFRVPIVALTVILSGFLDVFEAAAYMTLFGIKLAPHTIGALLMLMGWSVDSEVLFDTKILKRKEGDPKERALHAMKTAMTMSASVFASLIALYLFSNAKLVKDIAMILLLGAFFDLINTWFQSLSMVLWYVEGNK